MYILAVIKHLFIVRILLVALPYREVPWHPFRLLYLLYQCRNWAVESSAATRQTGLHGAKRTGHLKLERKARMLEEEGRIATS